MRVIAELCTFAGMSDLDRCRAGRFPGTRPSDARSGEQSAATGPLARADTDNPPDAAINRIINAHIASTLLTCFILDCSISISEQKRRARPDQGTIAKLTGMRKEARQLQRALDPRDAALIEMILKHYGQSRRR